MPANSKIWTIGHSTHPIEEFIRILRLHGIEQLVDIRTVPKSRHNPQFNRENLPDSLAAAGIAYEHVARLGGLRHARADSPNTGWRNVSFRGYADYMQTPEFPQALQHLIEIASGKRTAMMCAEAVQWRCHRSLVADALSIRGIEVAHIQSSGRTQEHKMTPFARVDGTTISYPEEK